MITFSESGGTSLQLKFSVQPVVRAIVGELTGHLRHVRYLKTIEVLPTARPKRIR